MKRLKIYYLYVGAPIILLTLIALIFRSQIIGTVQSNPHPQINYIIFALIIAGCVQMLLHIRRINREGIFVQKFFALYDTAERHELPNVEKFLHNEGINGKIDAAPVLALLLGLHDQSPEPLQHAAIEAELGRFQARQNRRLLLAQFMSGMMVGLGLLGTFIGLLGALAEIAKLIGSFNLAAGIENPTLSISELVTRLTEPMKAMGVAFSASLFGVLGSLIMGILLVSVRGAASDLASILQSLVGQALDFGRMTQQPSIDLKKDNPLVDVVNESPVLRALSIALDQSERRVREMQISLGQLAGQLETNTHAFADLLDLMKSEYQARTASHQTLATLQQDFSRFVQLQSDHQGATERRVLEDQVHGWTQVAASSQQAMQNMAVQIEQQLAKQTDHILRTHDSLNNVQNTTLQNLGELTNLLGEIARAVRNDSQSRTEFAHQLKIQLSEWQLRQESLVHAFTTQGKSFP